MLSSELEYCLNDAFQGAREERHEFITVEHLLLAVLDTPTVIETLKACGTDLARLGRELKDFMEGSTPRLPGEEAGDEAVEVGHCPLKSWRAMTRRWISLVPSPMVQILASRKYFSAR